VQKIVRKCLWGFLMWKILINSLRGQKTLLRISLLWDSAKIITILKNQDDKPRMAWCTVNQACSLSLFVLRGCICLTSLAELKNFILGIFIVVLKLSQQFSLCHVIEKDIHIGKTFQIHQWFLFRWSCYSWNMAMP